jgi:hypothetical protein
MFGHEAKPSRIWTFGAKAPHEGHDLVMRQIWLGHRYRNLLVKVERLRRDHIAALRAKLSPDLAILESSVAELNNQLDGVRSAIRAENTTRGRKTKGTPLQRQEIAALKRQLRQTKAMLKNEKRRVYGLDEWQAEQQRITDWAHSWQLRFRAAASRCGLYWGTYLVIEQSLSKCRCGPPPKYKSYRGEGRVAVQIQHGLTVAELLLGTDNRLRFIAPPQGDSITSKAGIRLPSRWHSGFLRVGSIGREPEWCGFRFRYHRTIPPDARIKWAWLKRTLIGTRYIWQLQVTLARDEWPKHDCAASGEVALDVGWRLFSDRMRVAVWESEDGSCGELSIPREMLDGWRRAETLRSQRDQLFNLARNQLAEWLEGRDVPEWLRQRAAYLRQWRSTRRLARLLWYWREHRFPGDESIFPLLDDHHSRTAWQQVDRHLYEWEANQRAKMSDWRLNLYREFVASLRRRYAIASVEDADWRKLAAKPPPEEDDAENRYYMRIASVGLLRRLIKEGFRKTLSKVTEYTTQTCHVCGTVQRFDAARKLNHRCVNPECCVIWDQDVNAARNLLSGPIGRERPGDE